MKRVVVRVWLGECQNQEQSARRVDRLSRLRTRHAGRLERRLDRGQHRATRKPQRQRRRGDTEPDPDEPDRCDPRLAPRAPPAPRATPALRAHRRPGTDRVADYRPDIPAMSMQPRPSVRPAGGFTLIEMLVALLILGIMSASVTAPIERHGSRQSAPRSLSAARASIEFGMRVIVMDFAQMVPRPVRDPLGQSRLPRCMDSPATAPAPVPPGRLSAAAAHRPPTSSSSSMHFNSDPGFSSSFGDSKSSSTIAAGGIHARRMVEHGRTAAQHPAAGLLCPGRRCAQAQLHHRARHRAGHHAGGAGAVRQGEDRAAALPRRQPDLAESMAAARPWPPRKVCGRGRSPSKITIEFKDWGRMRRLIEVAG